MWSSVASSSPDDYVPLSEMPAPIKEATGEQLKFQVHDGITAGMTIREMERELILKTLEENDLNRTHSARILGITRRTLQHKLKEYGIDHHADDGGEN